MDHNQRAPPIFGILEELKAASIQLASYAQLKIYDSSIATATTTIVCS